MSGKKIGLIFVLMLMYFIAGCSYDVGLDRNEWADRYDFENDEVFSIEIGDYGFPFIDVDINDKDIKMMFDTGNMVGLLVSANVAEQLDLNKIGEYIERDASGNIRGNYDIFDSEEVFVFGKNINIKIRESFSDSFEGIIPPSLLSNKRFTIDYSNEFIGVSENYFPKSIVKNKTFRLITNTDFPHLNSMPVIKGVVNGQEVFIQLDTGKSRTVVDEKLIEVLDLQLNKRGYKIESIKLGSFEFSVTNAKRGNFNGISRGYPGPIMLGLGSDIISEFVFTVDYPNQKVIISQ